MRFVGIDDCRERVLNSTSPNPGQSLIISYGQCIQVCGEGYGHYPKWTVISALTDWVIPLFLIVGNITYSKSASTVFEIWGRSCGPLLNWVAMISHLLVNPIDFIWNLALKLESGREIKKRIDTISTAPEGDSARPHVSMEPKEKKWLCGICYALEDFNNGTHVETLLKPFEEGDQAKAMRHWDAISPLLQSTARNIAGDRRHNKLHSVLAIIVYGKDVFVALLQTKNDQNFPYHVPHTLALRQLYYWLFCAIILSGAAGGFADQWSSDAFLAEFLEGRLSNLRKPAGGIIPRQENDIAPEQRNDTVPERREHIVSEQTIDIAAEQRDTTTPEQPDDIILEQIEPWNGGNYSWRYPKHGKNKKMTKRRKVLLLPAIAAVAVPFVFAFLMSFFTPTIGVGARGIMELSFGGMWLLMFGITLLASGRWSGRQLFKIYIWYTFWAVGSLIVLFAAFDGWYNSCASWSASFSRGTAAAYIDLNMRDTILDHIFSFYLPMTIGSLATQVVISGVLIWIYWEVIDFTTWSNGENRKFFERYRRSVQENPAPRSDQEDQSTPFLGNRNSIALSSLPPRLPTPSFDEEHGSQERLLDMNPATNAI